MLRDLVLQRPPSAAAEDRNEYEVCPECGWDAAAAAVRGGRGSQHFPHGLLPPIAWAAAAVRGGRGSQLREGRPAAPARTGSGRRPRRPRIATRRVGDAAQAGPGSGRRPRRPRIATSWRPRVRSWSRWQRPPSAAAEDRNLSTGLPTGGSSPAAAAVRGGRGSQHHVVPRVEASHPGSGRRPRRPRIATAVHVFLARGCCGQAPSSVSHHWPGAAFLCPARHR